MRRRQQRLRRRLQLDLPDRERAGAVRPRRTACVAVAVRRRHRRRQRDVRRRQHRLGRRVQLDLPGGAGLAVPARRTRSASPSRAATGSSPATSSATTATPTSGDGCSSTCKLEPGLRLRDPGHAARSRSATRPCAATARRRASRSATTATSIPYDGCSPTCTIEPKCSGGTCTAVCGDGLKFPQEQCDDGNTISRRRVQLDLHDRDRLDVHERDAGPARVARHPHPLPRHALRGHDDARARGTPTSRRSSPASSRGSCRRSSARTASRCGRRNGANPQALTGATDFCWWYHQTGCSGAGSTNPYDKLVYLDLGGQPDDAHARAAGRGHERLPVQQPARSTRSTASAGTRAPTRRRAPTAAAPPGTTSRSRASCTTRSRTWRARPSRRSTSPATTTSTASSTASSSSTSAASTAPRARSVTLDAAEAAALGLDRRRDVLDRHVPGRAPHVRFDLQAHARGLRPRRLAVPDGLRRRRRRRQRAVRQRHEQRQLRTCNPDCTLAPYCGDDKVQNPPEQCDDGVEPGHLRRDARRSAARAASGPVLRRRREERARGVRRRREQPVAGDRVRQERLHDGVPGAPYCGDGVAAAAVRREVRQRREQRQLRDLQPELHARPVLRRRDQERPRGVRQRREQPVAVARRTAQGICTTACTAAPYCGDGIVQAQFGEQCDSTPGCSAQCQLSSQ